MRRSTQSPKKVGRPGVARGVKVAVFAALLVLLAAVPLALANGVLPTSSTTYDFAATGAQGAAGEWKNVNQTVSITATPSADAAVTVHFSSDNGVHYTTQSAVNTQTATFPFVVSAEGSHAIRFYASDSSHVATETAQAPGFINIDKTDPVFTTTTGLATTSAQSAAAQWSSETSRTITLVATDTAPAIATSGVREIWRQVGSASAVTSPTASVEFTLAKGVGGVAEGSNEVSYYARDWAGNVETTQTGYVNIDTVEPTTTPSPALAADATSGWFKAPVAVTLGWTDASSGVPDGGTIYRVDDGNLTIYGVPFTVTTEGSTKLTYKSVDRALNVEATQTAYVNIDTSAPTVSATTAPSRSSGWYNKNVTVTLKGVDAVSGVKETQYRMRKTPAEAWKTAGANQFVVLASDNKVETFEFLALDKADNQSAVGKLTLRMDSVKPRTYAKNANGRVRTSMNLKYKITDNLSPKAQSIWIKVKDSHGRTQSKAVSGTKTTNKWFSFSWKPKARGTYKYYVYAKDLAGNAQKTPVGWGKITVR